MANLDLARFYVWFLFVLSVITAIARLAAARQFGAMMAAKLADPRRRRRQQWMGWSVLLLSPLILVYAFFGPLPAWMWVAAGIGMLNGAEQLLNTRFPDRDSLTYSSRIFGTLHALAAFAIWGLVLRYPAVR